MTMLTTTIKNNGGHADESHERSPLNLFLEDGNVIDEDDGSEMDVYEEDEEGIELDETRNLVFDTAGLTPSTSTLWWV